MRTVILLCLVLFLGAQASASNLLQEDIDRPTRADGQWAPSSVFISGVFTADGPRVVVFFQARVYGDSSQSWLRQVIDNVAVLPRSVYDAHVRHLTATDLSEYDWLANLPSYPVDILDHTTVNPADFALFDRFDTGPKAGWDLTQLAYWLDGDSAPTDDILHPSAATGGSLGLGRITDSPTATASTHFLVEGLTNGTEYVICFWWNALEDRNFDGVTFRDGNLRVTVLGQPEVAVQPTTWSQIKALYRN